MKSAIDKIKQSEYMESYSHLNLHTKYRPSHDNRNNFIFYDYINKYYYDNAPPNGQGIQKHGLESFIQNNIFHIENIIDKLKKI